MEGETEATVTCDNCGRDIPESKSFLHEAYCHRNVVRCPKCNEPVDKSEMEEHTNEAHKLSSCKHCKKSMEKRLLEDHEESCPQKPKLCQFCNCEVSGDEYAQHTYQCGSRTKKCPFCNKNILVRDYDDHEPVCQIKHENYDENFPAVQEEKKETPYSGISTKYMPNSTPSTNPYESLSQAPKSKTREQGTSKHESQPKRSSANEDTKPTSKPEIRNPVVSTKPSSSAQRQESSSYNYSSKPSVPTSKTGISESSSYNYSAKTREEKPTVPSSHTGSSKYGVPDTKVPSASTGYPSSSKYGVPDTKIPSVLDNQKPYSYQREDVSAGGYNKYGVSGTGSRLTNDVTSYNAMTSDIRAGGISNPTTQSTASKHTYLDNLATRAQPESYTKGVPSYGTGISADPRTGSSNRPKIEETRPQGYGNNYGYSVPESNKPKVSSTNPTVPTKHDPFSKAGLSSINKYSRAEDLISQNKVGTSEKTYLRGDSGRGASGTTYTGSNPKPSGPSDYSRPDDKKQFLSDFQRGAENKYGGSHPTQHPAPTSGASSNLNKRYETGKYEDPTKKASKLTDFNTKPSIDSRTQASKADPRSYEKKESLTGKSTGTSYKPSDATRSRDTGASHSTQSRKPTQNVPSYGNEVYEDEYGLNQDPELQKAIQESLGAAGKKPSSQSRRNHGNDIINQSVDDAELQRAIQESLKSYDQH